jgi:hypothetical protein
MQHFMQILSDAAALWYRLAAERRFCELKDRISIGHKGSFASIQTKKSPAR